MSEALGTDEIGACEPALKPGMHAPRDIQEILVILSWILLESPRFIEKSGYFQSMSIGYVFGQLKEGLDNVRETLGDERYRTLIKMSGQMQAHFEADPENKTGETRKGRDLVYEMEDILRQVRRNK